MVTKYKYLYIGPNQGALWTYTKGLSHDILFSFKLSSTGMLCQYKIIVPREIHIVKNIYTYTLNKVVWKIKQIWSMKYYIYITLKFIQNSCWVNGMKAISCIICDMIKGNESDVGNIDFELQA